MKKKQFKDLNKFEYTAFERALLENGGGRPATDYPELYCQDLDTIKIVHEHIDQKVMKHVGEICAISIDYGVSSNAAFGEFVCELVDAIMKYRKNTQ
ncbi:hypothetical protein [Carnobacterium pleistocenium]|uniref:hypothetical protein n=1 Tax=Carnobacterium pleistocenium TaxID=181073 RepID=UPI000553F05E|nr:hypothetical protein [Carnobacterium pleistocenium]